MDKITVLCPNGHRVTISTSRHTSLSEVLDDVCKKKNFDPQSHLLQHHDKNLDMSLTLHLANLPRNSQLEMVPAEVSQTGLSKNRAISNQAIWLSETTTVGVSLAPVANHKNVVQWSKLLIMLLASYLTRTFPCVLCQHYNLRSYCIIGSPNGL